MAKESETSSRKIQLNKMNTNIQIFTSEIFGEIRTCQVNNQIMFVGKDVATALGYSNTSKAIQQHVYKEDKSTLPIREGGYKTRAIAINESGLYSLVLSSKLPQARQFKRWVTSEVLPQIRKTGGYIPTKDSEGRLLTEEQIVEQAMGYSNTRDALSKHVDAEDKLESQIATSGQRRAIILINESGLSIVYWQSGEKATRGRALTFLTKKH